MYRGLRTQIGTLLLESAELMNVKKDTQHPTNSQGRTTDSCEVVEASEPSGGWKWIQIDLRPAVANTLFRLLPRLTHLTSHPHPSSQTTRGRNLLATYHHDGPGARIYFILN